MEQHANPVDPYENTNASMDGNNTRAMMWVTSEEKMRQLLLSSSGSVVTTNVKSNFRFGGVNTNKFPNGVSPLEFVVVKPDSHFMDNAGNSWGSSYLRMVLPIYGQDAESSITSVDSYKMPFRFWIKPSLSQRAVGQEISFELIGTDYNWAVENDDQPADLAISGTVTITANVATINFATPHKITGGMRVIVFWNTEKRLNVWPVYATIVTDKQITVPCTCTAGAQLAGGYVRVACPVWLATNACGELFENATATNATFWTKRNGCKPRPWSAVPTQTTITTTAWVQGNTSPYSDAWNAWNETEIMAGIEDVVFMDRVIDANNANNKRVEFNQTLPDEEKLYKIRIRAKNLKNLTVPIGNIVTAVKTGTTTATITMDRPHGLVSWDIIQTYGIRDIANFPNLTTAIAISSVIDEVSFTVVIAWVATASSYGGVVAINHGSVTLPWVINFSVQSIQRTGNILTATLNTTAAGLLPWETWTLAWMVNGAESYNGMYKVLRMTLTTIEFESIGDDFALINCGWAVVKNTELRVHGMVMLEYTREIVELAQWRGHGDVSNSLPVQVVSTPAISWSVALLAWVAAIGTVSPSVPATAYFLNSAATTNWNLILTWTSGVSSIYATNNLTTVAYVKLYNKATAPTVWTDVPEMIIPVPPAVGTTIWSVNIDCWFIGFRFALWLGIAITWGIADNDTTAVGAGQVKVKISRTI